MITSNETTHADWFFIVLLISSKCQKNSKRGPQSLLACLQAFYLRRLDNPQNHALQRLAQFLCLTPPSEGGDFEKQAPHPFLTVGGKSKIEANWTTILPFAEKLRKPPNRVD
jgi:hypothetical protein